MSRPDSSDPAAAASLRLPARLENLPQFTAFVAEQARQRQFPDKRLLEIELVLEEALVNIIKYAYPDEQPGDLTINLTHEADNRLQVEVKDRGRKFNPLEQSDPDLDAGLMERPIGGLGIVLIKELADSVTWQREDEQNCLTILFTHDHDHA